MEEEKCFLSNIGNLIVTNSNFIVKGIVHVRPSEAMLDITLSLIFK